MSINPVPSGVSIENTEYWVKIFDLSVIFSSIKESIAVADDGNSATATQNREEGDLIWLAEKLYKVTSDITAGEAYSASNTELVSIEELLNNILSIINGISSTVSTLQTTTLANRLWGKQIAIYGDSYSASPKGLLWQAVLNTMTGTTCHVSAQGSLTLPQIYSTKWDSYNADIYIIQSGLNDCSLNVTGNAFMDALESFVTAIRTINSNAEIYFMTPPKIPIETIHSHLFPVEFYRQCVWHLAPNLGIGVIDGLKWMGITYPDSVHPSDATCPLIGKYTFNSILNYGDSPSFQDDYSACNRANNQLLFVLISGQPYLRLQSLDVSSLASDGSGVVDISALGTAISMVRQSFTNKSGANYSQGLVQISGEGNVSSPTTMICAFEGLTSGTKKESA